MKNKYGLIKNCLYCKNEFTTRPRFNLYCSQPCKNPHNRVGHTPWNKGKTNVYTEETLEKMRNKIFTEESRQKMSNSQRGKKQSEETKKKNSEANKGRIMSEETKKKMSESRKEYWKNKKDNNGN